MTDLNSSRHPDWMEKVSELRAAWYRRPELRRAMVRHYEGVRSKIDRINSIGASDKRMAVARSYMRFVDSDGVSSASSFEGLPTRNRFIYAFLLANFPGCDRDGIDYGCKAGHNPYAGMFSSQRAEHPGDDIPLMEDLLRPMNEICGFCSDVDYA